MNNAAAPSAKSAGKARIPAGIWALGFVSLLMDVSSEMIHALLPVYMVAVLGTSVLAVGIIEGVALATAAIAKVFSGAISDWLGKRKLLAVIGYGLAALTKPIFPLASGLGWLVTARFIDRIGKGIRGAPRDALIADIAPPEVRGAAFGLRQSLDVAGGFVGPLIAIGLMFLFAGDFSAVFWVAVIPAFLSVFVLIAFVKEPPRPDDLRKVKMPLKRSELARLPKAYWWVVAIAAIFTLARFSEAFLILKAEALGLPMMWVPGVLVLMALAYSASAYPVGVLSDRMSKTALLICGLVLLVVADLVLAAATNLYILALGVVLWGLHMGFTQGLLATLIAGAAPAELRGTAFGLFNLVTGLMLLIASILAGLLWDQFGPGATFLTGAGFAAVSMVGLLMIGKKAELSATTI